MDMNGLISSYITLNENINFIKILHPVQTSYLGAVNHS